MSAKLVTNQRHKSLLQEELTFSFKVWAVSRGPRYFVTALSLWLAAHLKEETETAAE